MVSVQQVKFNLLDYLRGKRPINGNRTSGAPEKRLSGNPTNQDLACYCRSSLKYHYVPGPTSVSMLGSTARS